MIITPNEYLLWDNQNKWIWIFDKSGKYRNRITNLGLGPNEYSSVINFSFEEPNQINILSNADKCLLKFDTQGKFIRKINLEYYPADSYFKEKERYILFYHIPEKFKTPLFYLSKLDKNYMVSTGFFPYKNSLLSVDDNFFIKNRDKCYFHLPYNDTIYQIGQANVYPRYIVDFGEEHFPTKKIQNSSNLGKIDNLLEKKQYQGNMRNILISDHFISFEYSYTKGNTGKVAFVLYGLRNKNLHHYKSMLKVKEDVIILPPIATDGEYFYNITYAYFFPEKKLKEHPEWGSDPINTNPIILKIKYKK